MIEASEYALVRRVTVNLEREFRRRLFDANTDEEKRAAQTGLRHAIGFRMAVDTLSQDPREIRAALETQHSGGRS